MEKTKVRGRKSFTLVEVIIAVVLISILASLGLVGYYSSIKKAKRAQAVSSLGQIRKAEIINKAETGDFVEAENVQEINNLFDLSLNSQLYKYRVVGVTDNDFMIMASDIKTDRVMLAMDSKGRITDYDLSGGSIGFPGGSTGSSGGTTIGGGGSSSAGGGGGDSGGGGGGGGGGAGSGFGSGSGSGESSSGETEGSPGVPPTYDSSLEAALDLLDATTEGDYFYDLINDNNISLTYYDPLDQYYIDLGVSNALAFWWGIEHNTIYVNLDLKATCSEQEIAAIMVHEGTHADYEYFPQKWIDATKAAHPELTDDEIHIPGNSIDQEYHGMASMSEVWNEIKGDIQPVAIEGWVDAYAQGEAYTKDAIRSVYGGQSLDEY